MHIKVCALLESRAEDDKTSVGRDHTANSPVELAVGEVNRQRSTLQIFAGQTTSVRIADDSPPISWLHRFAAQVMNKNENW